MNEYAGIYTLQNTMVGGGGRHPCRPAWGGGDGWLGRKNENEEEVVIRPKISNRTILSKRVHVT